MTTKSLFRSPGQKKTSDELLCISIQSLNEQLFIAVLYSRPSLPPCVTIISKKVNQKLFGVKVCFLGSDSFFIDLAWLALVVVVVVTTEEGEERGIVEAETTSTQHSVLVVQSQWSVRPRQTVVSAPRIGVWPRIRRVEGNIIAPVWSVVFSRTPRRKNSWSITLDSRLTDMYTTWSYYLMQLLYY